MQGFEKHKRLLNKKEYEYVFADAKKTVNDEFIVLHRKNAVGHARLGLALSKKAVAKASQRNRLKRLIRESFRSNKLPAIDLVFLAKKNPNKKPNKNIDQVKNTLIHSNLSALWEKLAAYYAM